MGMPGRSWNAAITEGYRFGFSGKEQDDETYGDENEYDFGGRIYDPRLGRWLSVDPLQYKFPWISPYAYNLNNPISYIDEEGLEPTRLLSGTIEEAMKYFSDKGITDVGEIISIMKSTTKVIYDKGENEDNFVRYVYTEWMDRFSPLLWGC